METVQRQLVRGLGFLLFCSLLISPMQGQTSEWVSVIKYPDREVFLSMKSVQWISQDAAMIWEKSVYTPSGRRGLLKETKVDAASNLTLIEVTRDKQFKIHQRIFYDDNGNVVISVDFDKIGGSGYDRIPPDSYVSSLWSLFFEKL